LSRLAFIGAGRLGQVLAQAMAAQGESVVAVSSRNQEAAATLARRIPGCQVMTQEQALQAADLIFLTVSDDAIEPLARALPWRSGQAVVHCSGATELTALAAAVSRGATIGGFHPLQIFSDPERAAQLLAGSTVAIEAEPPLREELLRLAALLGMQPLQLPPGARAAYHAAASFSASFILSLLDEAVQIWAGVGLPQQQALQALLPLARGTLQAAEKRGLAGALSGPVSRGDVGVVAGHLQVLDSLGAEHGAFYRELSRRQLDLARASGRVDEQALNRLALLLGH